MILDSGYQSIRIRRTPGSRPNMGVTVWCGLKATRHGTGLFGASGRLRNGSGFGRLDELLDLTLIGRIYTQSLPKTWFMMNDGAILRLQKHPHHPLIPTQVGIHGEG